MFESFSVSASGMEAQRLRMSVIASNLANAETTRTAGGGAYRRRDILFRSHPVAGGFGSYLNASMKDQPTGVQVAGIVEDKRPLKYAYEPNHPDADKNGYVAYPNVNVSEEMVNMITASRSYEANVTAFRSARDMAQHALEIGD